MSIKSDHFPDRLKEVIKRIGSVAETARKLHVAESTVRKWRDGETDPQRKNIVELCKVGKVSIAWLAAGEGEMEHGKYQVVEDSPEYGVKERDSYLRALQLIEEVLQEANADIKPNKKVELVKIVAAMIEKEDANVVKPKLLQLVALAS